MKSPDEETVVPLSWCDYERHPSTHQRGAYHRRGEALRKTWAEHFHPIAVIIGRIVGALPDAFRQKQVEVLGEVDVVPVYVPLRLVTDGTGRVSLEAVLARRIVISAEAALLLARGGTIGLVFANNS